MSSTCHDRTSALSAGLRVDSLVTSAAGSCKIDSKQSAAHLIDVRNRSLLTFTIDTQSKCQTSRVRYSTGLGTSDTWTDQVSIAGRPGRRSSRIGQVQADLTCTGAAKFESIATDISVTYAGWPTAATGSLQVHVETLG
jgi:hypothetical protein